jgi:hypothetical protein
LAPIADLAAGSYSVTISGFFRHALQAVVDVVGSGFRLARDVAKAERRIAVGQATDIHAPPGTSPLCIDLCWRATPQALTDRSATSLKVTAFFFRARRLGLRGAYNRVRLMLCCYAKLLNNY